MTATLIYVAAVLLTISVLFSRAVRRRLVTARRELAADEALANESLGELDEAQRTLHDAGERLAGLNARLGQAQAEVGEAQRALEAARQAPTERYHVPDRLEVRPGTVWVAQVAHASWGAERAYLTIAPNQGEALERAGMRFPRAAGFEVRKVATCGLFGPDAARKR